MNIIFKNEDGFADVTAVNVIVNERGDYCFEIRTTEAVRFGGRSYDTRAEAYNVLFKLVNDSCLKPVIITREDL